MLLVDPFSTPLTQQQITRYANYCQGLRIAFYCLALNLSLWLLILGLETVDNFHSVDNLGKIAFYGLFFVLQLVYTHKLAKKQPNPFTAHLGAASLQQQRVDYPQIAVYCQKVRQIGRPLTVYEVAGLTHYAKKLNGVAFGDP